MNKAQKESGRRKRKKFREMLERIHQEKLDDILSS